jgi:hypothetical protein
LSELLFKGIIFFGQNAIDFGQNNPNVYKKKQTLLAKMWTKQWIIWPEWGQISEYLARIGRFDLSIYVLKS